MIQKGNLKANEKEQNFQNQKGHATKLVHMHISSNSTSINFLKKQKYKGGGEKEDECIITHIISQFSTDRYYYII